MNETFFLPYADSSYLEEVFQIYQSNPSLLPDDWRNFFSSLDREHKPRELSTSFTKEIQVLNLIHGYRHRGHLFTKNPVRKRRKYFPTLAIENFGLSEEDLDSIFEAGIEIGIGPAPLRKIVEHLQTTYCGSIGAEYIFIRQPDKVKWLQQKMESSQNTPKFSKEMKIHILKKLTQAVLFENFLHKRYVGQKRFALSGMEALIPALDTVIEEGARVGVKEFVIGMAHRGRLNVLANILKKSYTEIFAEFKDKDYVDFIFAGDVKYHKGYSSTVVTRDGKNIHLNLLPNPSHLEAIDSVLEGVTRAKIDKRYKGEMSQIVPILIHGDAAIAAQGSVYEVVQMSLLPGYHTGGTIHIVLNNQIGFTTDYIEGRSSTYCTDVAKVTLSPVFHVNTDDVEAVAFVIQLAMHYRQRFHTDVFIDLLGYRRYGHSEADDPRFTQPKLYKVIEGHPNPREIYLNKLLQEGVIEKESIRNIEQETEQLIHKSYEQKTQKLERNQYVSFKADWEGFRIPEDKDFEQSPDTSVDESTLLALGEKILTLPSHLKVFSKVRKFYERNKKLLFEHRKCNWTLGEYLAYGTLIQEGISVRLSGQDSRRGTFAHRHSVVLDEETEEEYIPLNHLSDRAKFHIYNSPLFEYGDLGFEFGYAWANPRGLTIWEAQFGDFANGAQIIIDQFLCCSQSKWGRYNGLVLYLPHGYEGQGPDHSSARIERFLQLCANNNMQVANCTTPANFFHLLRRQMSYPFRIPLIIFTPKSLLRHPLCQSPLEKFTTGGFCEVLEDSDVSYKDVSTLIFCSGKIYYDLIEKRQEKHRRDVAILRLEQLFPFPESQIKKALTKFSKIEKYFWVQEEPENMGAWNFIFRKWRFSEIHVISRPESNVTATSSPKQHKREQEQILEKAFS